MQFLRAPPDDLNVFKLEFTDSLLHQTRWKSHRSFWCVGWERPPLAPPYDMKHDKLSSLAWVTMQSSQLPVDLHSNLHLWSQLLGSGEELDCRFKWTECRGGGCSGALLLGTLTFIALWIVFMRWDRPAQACPQADTCHITLWIGFNRWTVRHQWLDLHWWSIG